MIRKCTNTHPKDHIKKSPGDSPFFCLLTAKRPPAHPEGVLHQPHIWEMIWDSPTMKVPSAFEIVKMVAKIVDMFIYNSFFLGF